MTGRFLKTYELLIFVENKSRIIVNYDSFSVLDILIWFDVRRDEASFLFRLSKVYA